MLAHLGLIEANRRGRRIGVYFLDEEVMYQSSVDQVEHLMGLFPDSVKRMWLQIPFFSDQCHLRRGGAVALLDGRARTVDAAQGGLNIKNKPWDQKDEKFRAGYDWLDFYGVIENFERCFENTAFLVGLRAAGESPNRWRAVVKNPVDIGGKAIYWCSRKGRTSRRIRSMTELHDVWRYIHDEKIRYSRIYDFQFKKGYPINQMRVSSLIHERAFKSLCDLPEFEPRTYNRLLKRIKGIALAQETGKSAKLFRASKLPKNFTSWITYRDFLLATHLDRRDARSSPSDSSGTPE